MLGSAATFSFFLAIGSVCLLLPVFVCLPLIISGAGNPKRRGASTAPRGRTSPALFSHDADEVRRLREHEVAVGAGEGAEVESPVT